MARIYTADEIIALKPCWPQEKIRELVGDGVTLQQIADCDEVDHSYRIWVMVRLVPVSVLRTWACDCAERALISERNAGREPDPRSWRAIEVARDPQATPKELDRVEADAWVAEAAVGARAARGAGAAAMAAGAAALAAWGAAMAARAMAAWAAALAAALAAVAEAEQSWQRNWLVKLAAKVDHGN